MNRAAKEIRMLEEVARGLGNLKDQFVFVGGATTALYLTDAAAPTPTPTDDVDLVVEVLSREDYRKLENKLRRLGFKDPIGAEDSPPICRKIFGSIQVDILPTDERILDFSNRWYKPGITAAGSIALPSGTEIRIFSLEYYLASKLEAFWSRGAPPNDIRQSQDLEDICAVLDGRPEAFDELQSATSEPREFIVDSFGRLLQTPAVFEEAIAGFIGYRPGSAPRVARVMQLLREVTR